MFDFKIPAERKSLFLILLQLFSLVLISLLSIWVWRYELFANGWGGLKWITYFHYAIPVIFCLFIIWMNLNVNLDWGKRAILNFIAVFCGLLFYFPLANSLVYTYSTGPSAMTSLIFIPEWKKFYLYYSQFAIIALIPLCIFFSLKALGKSPKIGLLVAAMFGMELSFYPALILLELLNQPGSQDMIHVYKSGMIIPFWIFFCGLVFIGTKENKSQILHDDYD